MSDSPDPLTVAYAGAHDYMSTACMHALHEECRKSCKWCADPCGCHCHGEQGEQK